jgi:hypothetical protein
MHGDCLAPVRHKEAATAQKPSNGIPERHRMALSTEGGWSAHQFPRLAYEMDPRRAKRRATNHFVATQSGFRVSYCSRESARVPTRCVRDRDRCERTDRRWRGHPPLIWPSARPKCGFTNAPMVLMVGTRSRRSSIRFGSSSAVIRLIPVAFAPGRAWLATKPRFTGSSPVTKTMGIVEAGPRQPDLMVSPASRHDYCHLSIDQIGSQSWEAVILPACPPILDGNVPPLDVSSIAQALTERCHAHWESRRLRFSVLQLDGCTTCHQLPSRPARGREPRPSILPCASRDVTLYRKAESPVRSAIPRLRPTACAIALCRGVPEPDLAKVCARPPVWRAVWPFRGHSR